MDLSYRVDDDVFDFGEWVTTEFQIPKCKTVIDETGRSEGLDNISPTVVVEELESEQVSDTASDHLFNVPSSSVRDKADTVPVSFPLNKKPSNEVSRDEQDTIRYRAFSESSLEQHFPDSAVLNIVDDQDAEDECESVFQSLYYDKTYQDFLTDAAESCPSTDYCESEMISESTPPLHERTDAEFLRETSFTGTEEGIYSDSNFLTEYNSIRLFDSMLFSSALPKKSLHDDFGETSGKSAFTQELDYEGDNSILKFAQQLDYDDLPISRGVRLITSGSSIELGLLTKSAFPDRHEQTGLKSQPVNVLKEKTDLKRARQLKEVTILHRDFADLEDGDLTKLFAPVPPKKVNKGEPVKRKKKSDLKEPSEVPNPFPGVAAGQFFLHSKDRSRAMAKEPEPEPQPQIDINLEDPDKWHRTLHTAFDLEDDILGDITFKQAEILTLLTLLESIAEDLCSVDRSSDAFTSGELKPHPPTALSIASSKVAKGFQKFSLIALNTPGMPTYAKSADEDSTTELDLKQREEAPLNNVAYTLVSEVSASLPGAVTAFLCLARPANEANSAQEHWHQQSQSTVIQGVEEVRPSDCILNNRFVSATNGSPKWKRSIGKILAKSLAAGGSGNKSMLFKDDSIRTRKSMSGISLKSPWRSKTTEEPRSNFNIESGLSLTGYAAMYTASNDLALPVDGAMMSRGGEEAKKMLSSDPEVVDEVALESKGSLYSDGTLNSLMDDKLRAKKSISEYIPTPAPVAPKTYLYEVERKWFGLRRVKMLAERQPTIRFAAEPIFITEPVKELDRHNTEQSDGTSEEYSQTRAKPILKRHATLGTPKKGAGLRSFFSGRTA